MLAAGSLLDLSIFASSQPFTQAPQSRFCHSFQVAPSAPRPVRPSWSVIRFANSSFFPPLHRSALPGAASSKRLVSRLPSGGSRPRWHRPVYFSWPLSTRYARCADHRSCVVSFYLLHSYVSPSSFGGGRSFFRFSCGAKGRGIRLLPSRRDDNPPPPPPPQTTKTTNQTKKTIGRDPGATSSFQCEPPQR